MLAALIDAWKTRTKVVIGMCHAPALPGSPLHTLDRRAILDHVLRDARALAEGGVHGLMLENFGDVPFYPDHVPPWVVAHLTAVACAVKREIPLPLGINVLRNDGRSALSVAHAAGADFLRVNVHTHARLTDQGVLQAGAHDLLRDRMLLRAEHIRIFADVDAKESVPIAPGLSIEDETDDLVRRGLADAVIVSGANTGGAADPDKVRRVKSAAGGAPVFIGSGIRAETIDQYLPHADGFIVGSSLKQSADPRSPVDVKRVRALLARLG